MDGMDTPAEHELIADLDRSNAAVCAEQRRMLGLIALLERSELWRDHGVEDVSHFLSVRYGISGWKADRWVAAARALEDLPRIASAFEEGRIGIDKVVELCRFATPEDEAALLRWAAGVSCGAIRRRAELEARRGREEAARAEREREVKIWYTDEGTRGELFARLPAPQMAVVEARLDRLADRLPVMPGEDEPCFRSARLADALVALCSGAGGSGSGALCSGSDPSEPDRPAIVIHAPVEVLGTRDRSCAVVVDGRAHQALAHVETVRRLACTSRIQVVLEDRHGNAVAMGRTTRVPSAAMLRQLVYRDTECRFPGCGARRFTQAHHIRWWSRGGRTDLDNLVLLCTFHHTLVHEHGWSLVRDADNAVRWYRPDGRAYRAGPAPPAIGPAPPPVGATDRRPALAAWVPRAAG